MPAKLILPMLFLAPALLAQTVINKTVPIQPGQIVEMHFDYPQLIRVTTWAKNEVSVQGTVSINDGENDDAFELNTSASGHVVSVSNQIHNMKSLPHRITVVRDGQKVVFKTQADYEKYTDQNGKGFTMKSNGVDIDIVLEIKVPVNVETRVESVYGMVEVTAFAGPLTVQATYGGVDASLSEPTTGELIAETNYGEIYTNLQVKFSGDNIRQRDFHTFVSAKPGAGPRYRFESKYGNVYLRKPQMH
jgi:hypothetical protein